MKPNTEELIRNAIQDWRVGKLTEMSALTVIDSLLNPAKPSEADLQWAKETLSQRCAIKEMRAGHAGRPATCLVDGCAARNMIIEECALAVIGARVLWDDDYKTIGESVQDVLEQVAAQVRKLSK